MDIPSLPRRDHSRVLLVSVDLTNFLMLLMVGILVGCWFVDGYWYPWYVQSLE